MAWYLVKGRGNFTFTLTNTTQYTHKTQLANLPRYWNYWR